MLTTHSFVCTLHWSVCLLQGETPDEKPRKIREEGIELSAEAPKDGTVRVSGTGFNTFGSFTIKGLFNIAKRQMMMTKQ